MLSSQSQSSSELHLRPWQADWKNPEWKISTKKKKKKKTKRQQNSAEEGEGEDTTTIKSKEAASLSTTTTTNAKSSFKKRTKFPNKKWAGTGDDDDDNDNASKCSSSTSTSTSVSSRYWIVGTTSAQVTLSELPKDLLYHLDQEEEKIVEELKEDNNNNNNKTNRQQENHPKDNEKIKSILSPSKKEHDGGKSTTEKNSDENDDSSDDDDDNDEIEVEEEEYFTLSVTLVSKISNSNVATELILELMKETTMEILYSKKLLWPETILDNNSNNEEEEGKKKVEKVDKEEDNETTRSQNSNIWKNITSRWTSLFVPDLSNFDLSSSSRNKQKRNKKKKGLVSATFCRRNDYEYYNSKTTSWGRNIHDNNSNNPLQVSTEEALDTIAWMGLGMETTMITTTTTSPTNNTTATSNTNTPNNNKPVEQQMQQKQQQQQQQQNDKGDNNNINSNDIIEENKDVSESKNDGDDDDDDDDDKDYYDDPLPTTSSSSSSSFRRKSYLYLACVTNKGLLTIYSPWDLLVEFKNDNDDGHGGKNNKNTGGGSNNNNNYSSNVAAAEEEMENAMTYLFFGSDLYTTLQQTWKPLCQPLHSMTVSIMESSSSPPWIKEDEDEDEVGRGEEGASISSVVNNDKYHFDNDNNINNPTTKTTTAASYVHDGDDTAPTSEHQQHPGNASSTEVHTGGGGGGVNVWDIDLWNPLLESWTIPYRTTIQNHVTHVTMAGQSYLVLLGQGKRRVADRRGVKTQDRTHSNSKSTKFDLQEEEGNQRNIGEEDEEEKEEETDESTNPFSTPSKPTKPEATTAAGTASSNMPVGDRNDNKNVESFPDILTTSGTPSSDDVPWWANTPKDEREGRSTNIHSRAKSHCTTDSNIEKKKTNTSKRHDGRRRSLIAAKPTTTTSGGFVTFVSMKHWSETRTLFLPFVPKSATYIANWNSMELLLVIGDHDAWTIRMDASFVPVKIGDVVAIPDIGSNNSAILDDDLKPSPTATAGAALEQTPEQQQSSGIWVRRFQALPLSLQGSNRPTSHILCGTADAVQPPALMELYTEEEDSFFQKQDEQRKESVGLVLLKTFKAMTTTGRIELAHSPGHVAKIPGSDAPLLAASATTGASFIGQGWSLLASQKCVYWICWEGATASRGVAFVEGFPELAPGSNNPNSRIRCFVSNVLPVDFHNKDINRMEMMMNLADGYNDSSRGIRAKSLHLPFSGPYDKSTVSAGGEKFIPKKPIENPNDTKSSPADTAVVAVEGSDDIVVDALESISAFTFVRGKEEDLQWLSLDDNKETKNSSSLFQHDSPKRFSHREKSERLLRQCSSWAQLESTRDNRLLLERQVPVVSVRFGTLSNPARVLTLRHLTVHNGPASPFQQVLSWLCNRHDYFTAASIALDLLNDPESLYHLWKHAEKIDEEDEQNKLDGLLDGIIPVKEALRREAAAVRAETNDGAQLPSQMPSSSSSPILVQLADMTVGCLIKGGWAMSKTLNKFLQNDTHYDAARACLMLVATTANALSGDPSSTKDAMGDDVGIQDTLKIGNLLWPVKCLLQIGVSRDYLSTCLVLLNVTIPDELRRRPRQGRKLSIPSMELTKSLITLILSCDHPDTIDLLLGLVDDHSRVRYWQSLAKETRLALSLISTDKKYPLLKEHEVRSWIRSELHHVMKDAAAESSLPTDWLRELAIACLQNAGCDLSDFVLDSDRNDDEDGLGKHKMEIEETRNALMSDNEGGGPDFDYDLFIPCLLLLQNRQAIWTGDGEYVSTQSLLDAVCYLAGRDTIKNHEEGEEEAEEESLFDGPTAMRQCALAGNVRAAANLIGGTNGFVLSCCDVLMVEMQVSMEDAESFLLEDGISLDIMEKSEPFQSSFFQLTDSHRELLWMLDEHVLSIRTFGDFETTHLRGRVDPVFCSRSILRAWLVLTYSVREHGSAWLVQWLRIRLDMWGGDSSSPSSPHRLACAALVRALVWPSNASLSADHAIASGQMLGQLLGLENKFLLELAQSCCGLVESVPTEVAEDVLSGSTASVLDGRVLS